MKKIYFFVVALLVVITCCGESAREKELREKANLSFDQIMKSGKREEQCNRLYKETVPLWNELMKINPKSSFPLEMLGGIYFLCNNLSEAQKYADLADKIDQTGCFPLKVNIAIKSKKYSEVPQLMKKLITSCGEEMVMQSPQLWDYRELIYQIDHNADPSTYRYLGDWYVTFDQGN